MDVDSAGVYDTTWMLQNYETCLNTIGNTEQWCAAQDSCLAQNSFNSTFCTDSEILSYENPAWVSGNC